ncbi:s-adenosylmethionine mitochondrial carrier protein [Nannochloropsis oceanica]
MDSNCRRRPPRREGTTPPYPHHSAFSSSWPSRLLLGLSCCCLATASAFIPPANHLRSSISSSPYLSLCTPHSPRPTSSFKLARHLNSAAKDEVPPSAPSSSAEASTSKSESTKHRGRIREGDAPPPSLKSTAQDNDLSHPSSSEIRSPLPSAPSSDDDHWRVLQGAALISVLVGGIVLVGATENFHHGPNLAALVPPTYSFEKSLLSGAAAGISRGLSRIVTFPLDTIKTRQQAVLILNDDEDEAGRGGRGKNVAEKLNSRASKVKKGRLFDGILPMLLIAGPANAAFFVTYDYLGALATGLGYPPKGHILIELFTSLLSSLPANLIRVPAEVTKQRVQAGQAASAFKAASTILKTEGPLGLYVGGGAHLLREIPFNAVQFVSYRHMKDFLVASQGGIHASVAAKAVLGAVAAGLASLMTQPLDTIKTAQMLNVKKGTKIEGEQGGKEEGGESYFDSASRIYSRFGFPGLYLGLLPRFGLCAVGGAFYFYANEWAVGILTTGGGHLLHIWLK